MDSPLRAYHEEIFADHLRKEDKSPIEPLNKQAQIETRVSSSQVVRIVQSIHLHKIILAFLVRLLVYWKPLI